MLWNAATSAFETRGQLKVSRSEAISSQDCVSVDSTILPRTLTYTRPNYNSTTDIVEINAIVVHLWCGGGEVSREGVAV